MSAQRILDSVDKILRRQAALTEFRTCATIMVWAKKREGEMTRLQACECVCIRRASMGARSTFTVRKISYGVGVERIFPDNSPNIDKIEVIARGRVHQARLYYLRDLSGKAARIKEREGTGEAETQAEAAPAAATADGAEGAAAAGAAAREGATFRRARDGTTARASRDGTTARASRDRTTALGRWSRDWRLARWSRDRRLARRSRQKPIHAMEPPLARRAMERPLAPRAIEPPLSADGAATGASRDGAATALSRLARARMSRDGIRAAFAVSTTTRARDLSRSNLDLRNGARARARALWTLWSAATRTRAPARRSTSPPAHHALCTPLARARARGPRMSDGRATTVRKSRCVARLVNATCS